jgi:hypothetical protein
LVLLCVILWSNAVNGDLLLPEFPQEWGRERWLLELLGYKHSEEEPVVPDMPAELQQVLNDLMDRENWAIRKRALLALGLDRTIKEWQNFDRLFRNYYPKTHVVGQDYDGDGRIEYVVLVPGISSDFPPYLIYIDESLIEHRPVVYEPSYMYEWFLLIKDVNRDGLDDFIFCAAERHRSWV